MAPNIADQINPERHIGRLRPDFDRSHDGSLPPQFLARVAAGAPEGPKFYSRPASPVNAGQIPGTAHTDRGTRIASFVGTHPDNRARPTAVTQLGRTELQAQLDKLISIPNWEMNRDLTYAVEKIRSLLNGMQKPIRPRLREAGRPVQLSPGQTGLTIGDLLFGSPQDDQLLGHLIHYQLKPGSIAPR